MKRKGATSGMVLAAFVLGAIVVGGTVATVTGNLNPKSTFSGVNPAQSSSHNCGDDAQCAIDITWENLLNDTNTEKRDVNLVINSDDGATQKDVSATKGDEVKLPAGKSYTVEVKSSDTVNSYIHDSSLGQTTSDGAVTFTATTEGDLKLKGEDHASLEAKVYDNLNQKFLNGTSTLGSTGNYQTDGETFQDGASAIDVGSGGDVDVDYSVRTQNFDSEFSDQGTIVGVKASTTKYNEPTVKFEGSSLSEVGVSGIPENAQDNLGSTYDYFYELERGAFNQEDSPDNYVRTLEFAISAQSGSDPADSDDVQVDLISKGKYEPAQGDNSLEVDTHDDGDTAIQTIFDTKLDIK